MGRAVTEWLSRQHAGIIDETDKWYWVRVLGRFEMYVMKDDKSLTPHLVGEGFWESWITQWFINNIDVASVVHDIGANCGYYSLLAMSCGAIVSSYEPNPDYYEMLLATKERNKIGNFWRITNAAISDKEGTETLYIPRELHGSASFTKMDEKYDVREIEVRTITAPSVNGAGRHFVKIDAEGAEEKIWDSLYPRLLERTIRPAPVLLEYTPGAYSDQFLDKLEAYAPLRWINHDGQEEPVSREWILSRTDWVMLILRP